MKQTLSLGVVWALVVLAVQSTRAEEKDDPFGTIHRHDAALDKLIPRNAKLEKLADGFEWSEGPVWVKDGGYVLFSDIPRNQIIKWQEGQGAKVWMERSGYTGKEKFTGAEPGCNGLMLDASGRLVYCCHGDRLLRRLEKMEADAKKTTLIDKFQGKRLNSPNDLVFHANGNLYFTDPPYGLPKRYDDPARELDWCGVYRLDTAGNLTLLTQEMTRPNGIAFSPDQRTLYVAQSDPKEAIIKAFRVRRNGTLGRSRVIYDGTKYVGKRPGLPDGMCVDQSGHIFATTPGGVTILTPEGKILGRISTGERTANCTFGGKDGRVLFITADMYFCRIQTSTKGLGF